VLVSINEVNLSRAQLVLGWVTVSGFNCRCGTFISVWNQQPRSTQPGYPFASRCNEYQPKGGDALRLGSKGRYGSCEGWQIKLCDHLVTRVTSVHFRNKWLTYKVLYKFICLLFTVPSISIIIEETQQKLTVQNKLDCIKSEVVE